MSQGSGRVSQRTQRDGLPLDLDGAECGSLWLVVEGHPSRSQGLGSGMELERWAGRSGSGVGERRQTDPESLRPIAKAFSWALSWACGVLEGYYNLKLLFSRTVLAAMQRQKGRQTI